jgi:hypothetical protein
VAHILQSPVAKSTISPSACPRPRIASVGAGPLSSNRIDPHGAVPSVIEELRAKVRAIEQPRTTWGDESGAVSSLPRWTLGVAALDVALGGPSGLEGLDPAGVHEVKPALKHGACAASQRVAALGFAVRLAVRRMHGLAAEQAKNGSLADNMRGRAHCRDTSPTEPPVEAAVVWCQPLAMAHEIGHLHGAGLTALGVDLAGVILVETSRAGDVLFAMEEALRSGAAGLVVGMLGEVDLTSARRLSLAAQESRTPCVLLTHGASATTAATWSRWRIGLRSSPFDPLDPRAPGGYAADVSIERCRANPSFSHTLPFALEWCDEAHRFRVPAGLVDRASGVETRRWPLRTA